MRRYRDELTKYLRYKKHYAYVETRVVQLRNKICRDATLHGVIGTTTRELYLKYNNYLIKLNEKKR